MMIKLLVVVVILYLAKHAELIRLPLLTHLHQWRDRYWWSHGYSMPMIMSQNVTEFGHWSRKDFVKCPRIRHRIPGFIGYRLKNQQPYTWFEESAVTSVAFLCGGHDHTTGDQNIDMYDRKVLTSIIASRGQWGKWLMCPPNSFAVGFRVRFLEPQGEGDDLGVTNVNVKCSKASNHSVRVTYLEGDGDRDVGDWGEWHECPHDYVPCMLKAMVETSRIYYPYDNTGLNGFIWVCCPFQQVPF